MKCYSMTRGGLTQFISTTPAPQFTGSSKYKMSEGELYEPIKLDINKFENEDTRLSYLYSIVLDCPDPDMKLRIQRRITELEKEKDQCRYSHPDRPRSDVRKINKSKVKNKIFALFNLKKSRRFVAFYSVSFPTGFPDDNCFVAWNAFLTACRKRFALTNYVWVSERQKNGTIHFHMLTNDYMDIKSINGAMAIIIDNLIKRDNLSWGNSSLAKYNGVDVDSVYNSKRHKKTGKTLNNTELRRWLTSYITKYVTKNTSCFTHQSWHQSRTISVLFTSMIFSEDDKFYVTKYLPRDPDKYFKIVDKYYTAFIFRFHPDNRIYTALDEINEYIFNLNQTSPPDENVHFAEDGQRSVASPGLAFAG